MTSAKISSAVSRIGSWPLVFSERSRNDEARRDPATARDSGRRRSSTAAPASQPLPDDLTPRELEVLKVIAQGLSNAEIAETLVVGAATVKTYVTGSSSRPARAIARMPCALRISTA
jgi:DNA-binding NarL/FixJ family response regulator